MVRKVQIILLSLLALLCVPALSSAQDKSEQKDSLIRLVRASSVQIITDDNDDVFRKAVDAVFLHNGAYMLCDTAIWNVNAKIVNAKGHVSLKQEGTILTSDRMDYLIDDDLAQFRGPQVQLVDKDGNKLRTRILDYNTADSVGVFSKGASMQSHNGQVIESINGKYDSKASLFEFRDDVNMYTDSTFVRTEKLDYHSDTDEAVFIDYIDFWNDDNMLSAAAGWYRRPDSTFFFTGHVHGTSERQETWCDSLYYYHRTGDMLMLGSAHIQDSTRSTAALAERVFYVDSTSTVTLTRNAAVAIVTNEEERTDTVYFGADTLVYWTLRRCDIPPADTAASAKRLSDIEFDAVNQYRENAAKAAAEAAAQAREQDLQAKSAADAAKKRAAQNPELADPDAERRAQEAELAAQMEQMNQQMAAQADSIAAANAENMITMQWTDSLTNAGVPEDQLQFHIDSLFRLKAIADSIAALPIPDTTKVGFVTGKGHVKIYRWDMQVVCDSMRYTELDSIACFYLDPVVWNEERRQYSSDSLFALIRGGRVDKASLQSNAFIITQEDTVCYDQILGAEVLAYFDSTSALSRFDALGGAVSLFYLEENGTLATVNKVECKMMSAIFKDGNMERVHYFDQPKNDAYPIVQLPKSESRLRGFNWRPELRPRDKYDITTLEILPYERQAYARHPRARFEQTDIYFPGHMKGIYAAIAAAEAAKNAPKPSEDPTVRDRHKAEAGNVDIAAPSESAAIPGSAGTSTVPADSAALALAGTDSLGLGTAAPDSLSAAADSLGLSPDSLAVALDSLGLDSLAVASDTLTAEQIAAAERAAKIKAREDARKAKADARAAADSARTAAREAKWAVLDSLDAAKAAVKAEKLAAKELKRHRKLAIKQLQEDAREQATLQKYINRYNKRKNSKHKWKPSSTDSSDTSLSTPSLQSNPSPNLPPPNN